MEKEYYAHISYDNNIRYQTINEHCKNAAIYAVKRLGMDKLKHTTYLASVLHDMGKYSNDFQNYLENASKGQEVVKGSVNHTFAGVIYVLERYHTKELSYASLTSEIIAFAIGAHHGLFDFVSIENESGFEHRLAKERRDIQYDLVKERFLLDADFQKGLDVEFELAVEEIKELYNQLKQNAVLQSDRKYIHRNIQYSLGIIAKMVLSAVMYGDRLDTCEFMENVIHKDYDVSSIFWTEQLSYLEKKLLSFEKTCDMNSDINVQRKKISDECKEFAKNGNGIYKLSVPTGAGKTLSTLRYAYTLAKQERKQRVIFVIPLLSVLDQNSQVIRQYTKNVDEIGEYHSNVWQAKETTGDLNYTQLVSDFWDKPIIITTLYQILMNLFASTTSYVTRMSSLSNSIIIIDEAQSIPMKVVNMFNMAVNVLSNIFNSTVLMCSATQPCFESTEFPINFTAPVDMIKKNSQMNEAFIRNRVKNCTTKFGMSTTELADFCVDKLQAVRSLLLICNTKKEARDLYSCICNIASDKCKIFHLSTAMCVRHRKDVLEDINECLDAKNETKMICVSTQLVEAGIDFSFESVVRIVAGIDNLVQAAGRCNRNGEYHHICDVYLVNYAEENLSKLTEIKEAQRSTRNLIEAFNRDTGRFKDNLLSDESIEFYYRSLFNEYSASGIMNYRQKDIDSTLFELMSANQSHTDMLKNQKTYFMHQALLEAGKRFKVFDSNTIDVIVPYKEGKEVIAELCSSKSNYDISYK